MKKIEFLMLSLLMLTIIFSGCSKSEATIINNTVEDEYPIIGTIICFNGDEVHILSGDIVEVRKIGADKLIDFYIG